MMNYCIQKASWSFVVTTAILYRMVQIKRFFFFVCFVVLFLLSKVCSFKLQGRVVHKMPYFVICLRFLVLNIFSIFFRNVVAKCKEIIPRIFQVCTTKSDSTAASLIIRHPISGFVFDVFLEIRDLTVDSRCGYSFCNTYLKLIG